MKFFPGLIAYEQVKKWYSTVSDDLLHHVFFDKAGYQKLLIPSKLDKKIPGESLWFQRFWDFP